MWREETPSPSNRLRILAVLIVLVVFASLLCHCATSACGTRAGSSRSSIERSITDRGASSSAL